MPDNLLKSSWTDLDSAELRILLHERVGGPGQYDNVLDNPNKLYLPVARSFCRIVLTFRNKRMVAVKPGPAFDASEWDRISEEIEKSILAGPMKVGREYSFSTYRVSGSWRGQRSGVQIIPPPDDAPRADLESADHPFILEFPLRSTGLWEITNHRRIQEHRRLTLLLNVLLAGRTRPLESWGGSLHFWASVPGDHGDECKWVRQFFFANLGQPVTDELLPPAAELLEEIEPETYYARVGHDGKGLRVPGSDLIQMDEDRAFGWDPPWWNERELYNELWGLTRIALRTWLKKPPAG